MKAHRHYEDGGHSHIFVGEDGSRYVRSQGYSQFIGKLPDGAPCPDCEEEAKQRPNTAKAGEKGGNGE